MDVMILHTSSNYPRGALTVAKLHIYGRVIAMIYDPCGETGGSFFSKPTSSVLACTAWNDGSGNSWLLGSNHTSCVEFGER